MQIEKILTIPKPEVSLSDFIWDEPFEVTKKAQDFSVQEGAINGVQLIPLHSATDHRGALTELITGRDNIIEEIVHVYQVSAKADSRRAWIYHQHHTDRLAFTDGHFRIVLYDLRVNSPTFGILNILTGGIEQPILLLIPPYVIHGVHNMGAKDASYINMPTKFWDPLHPDKLRIPEKDPRIPFSFDA
jgi:dTDP-4-dehydrorhamnose 3,5-epimerase